MNSKDIATDLALMHLELNEQDGKNYGVIRDALRSISGKSVDTGFGLGGADFWVSVNGVEYFVTARRSNNQIKDDSRNAGNLN